MATIDDYTNGTSEEFDPRQPIGIVIASPPTKTVYTAGETFDRTGMTVELLHLTRRRVVITDYTVKPSGALKSSDTFVEITGSGLTVRQRIRVYPQADCSADADSCIHDCRSDYIPHHHAYGCTHPEDNLDIVRMRIEKPPFKCQYYEGEMLDITGLTVKGSRRDTPNVFDTDITAYTVMQSGPLACNVKRITIVYKGFRDYFTVTVLPKFRIKAAPAKETVVHVGGVEGNVLIESGEFTAAFDDVTVSDGVLDTAIRHIFTNKGVSDNFGAGWNLNLDCTLKPFDSDIDGKALKVLDSSKEDADYVYTDENGVKYTFDDRYYYINSIGGRDNVDKDEVQVNMDGKLFYDDDGIVYDVVREFTTVSGLTLTAKLDNIKGVEKIEQRYEEIAKLESEIQQYNDIITELKYNISQFGHYLASAPNPTEIEEIEFSDRVNEIFDNDYIGQRIEESQQKINEISVNNETIETDKVISLLNDLVILPDLKKYNQKLRRQYLDSTKEEEIQHRKDLKAQYELRLEEYNRTLEQKQHQLEIYKKQIPVAYLTDGDGTSMCFNEFGDLCGIVDKFDNIIAITRDEKSTVNGKRNFITSVLSGEHETTLDYDIYGRLVKITNYDGNTVEYKYGKRDELESATFSDGRKLCFDYNCENRMVAVTSPSTAEGANLTYAEHRLSQIMCKSLYYTLNDSTPNDSGKSLTTTVTRVTYRDGEISVSTDGTSKTCYLDRYGRLVGSYIKDGVTYLKRHTYTYKSDYPNEYTVTEIGDAVWSSDELTSPSGKPVAVITANMLKKGVTDYVFSAVANKTTEEKDSNYDPLIITPFMRESLNRKNIFRITAKVIQNGCSSEYKASFDYGNNREQFVALPVRLDKKYLDGKERIELYAECTSQNVVFDKLRLAPAEWEYRLKNAFGKVIKTESSERPIAPGVYASESSHLLYDGKGRVTTEKRTVNLTGEVNSSKTQVTKYTYCEHGNLIKTETYIDGEERTKGIDITERECDEKGHVKREWTYNTLDSSTKFYRENEYKEDGTVTAEIDETGENKAEFEYIAGTKKIKTETLPNGSKLSYGYDGDGNVTSVTQSTDDGESNSMEIRYIFGSPTRLTSGNNTVLYEYDTRRRLTKAEVNGKVTEYAIDEYTKTESIRIGEHWFDSVVADQYVVTTEDNVFETYKDRRGIPVMTKVNGTVFTVNLYDKDSKLLTSGDNITGSVKKFTYTEDGTDALQSVTVSAGVDVDALTETYFYNTYGQQSGKTISGAAEQNYAYFYKDNAARELEHIALPNGLSSYPQTDVNGRNTGKELKDVNGMSVYSEDIYYRKVGDHGTNMPSSIYFGKNKNNRYSVSDNIKYKYDESGNISEVKENGVLTVKYTYDKIGRLVREDNKNLGKTILLNYDNCGNILSKREASFTLKPAGEITEFASEKQYAYDGDKLLSFGNEVMLYVDENGKDQTNPSIYRGHTLSWDFGKQLKSFGENVFTYDGYGRRVKKNSTVFTYDADSRLIKQSDGTNTLEFIYDNGGLSGVNHNGTAYIYSKDVLSNIVGMLDITGREVVQYAYDAWGNCKATVLDETHAAIAELNPFLYRSYYYDSETNLYYLNTRYYDPEVGRFISQDDVSYLDPEHVNGLNLFAYCGNNPVMNVDYNGTFIISLIVGLAIASAVVGATVGGTVAYIKAKEAGYSGWDLFGWTLLGTFGGGVGGAAVGAFVGWVAPAIGAFMGTTFTIGSVITTSGAAVAVTVTGAQIVAGAIALAASIGLLFYKEHRKNSNPANRKKHEGGEARRKRDQWGEKGDKRRTRIRKQHGFLWFLLELFFDEDE